MRLILLVFAFALGAGAAHAQNWGNIAIISGTMGNYANRICVGEGTRPSDIGCPTYAPSLTTAGGLIVSGTVTGSKFIGDGSGLTNINAGAIIGLTADRLTSGTALVVLNGDGTLAAQNFTAWGAAITALRAANVSVTGNLSAGGTITAAEFIGDGSGLTGVVASSGDRIVSGTTSMLAVSASGFISVTQAGTNTGWFDPTRGLVTIGVSSTGSISGTGGYFKNVGVGVIPSVGYSIVAAQAINTNAVFQSSFGSANAPAYQFTASNNTGIFAPAVNTLGFSVSGTEAARIASNGSVGIGTGNPNAKLDVYGTISATNLLVNGLPVTGNTTDRLVSGSALVVLNGDGTLAAQNFTAWGAAVTALRAAQVSVTGNIAAVGSVTAAQFIGDGSQLTGVGQGDRIVSGTAFVKATQDTGGEVSGTFKVTSTGNETCGPSTYNSIRVNPTTNRIEICRP